MTDCLARTTLGAPVAEKPGNGRPEAYEAKAKAKAKAKARSPSAER